MGAEGIPPREISTFGHWLALRASTGEQGGEKGAAQAVGALPDAAWLPGPSAPKCPKVAFSIDPKIK